MIQNHHYFAASGIKSYCFHAQFPPIPVTKMHRKLHFLLAWPPKSISIPILTPSGALCSVILVSDCRDILFPPPSFCCSQTAVIKKSGRCWAAGAEPQVAPLKTNWGGGKRVLRLRARSAIPGDLSAPPLRRGFGLDK